MSGTILSSSKQNENPSSGVFCFCLLRSKSAAFGAKCHPREYYHLRIGNCIRSISASMRRASAEAQHWEALTPCNLHSECICPLLKGRFSLPSGVTPSVALLLESSTPFLKGKERQQRPERFTVLPVAQRAGAQPELPPQQTPLPSFHLPRAAFFSAALLLPL